MRSKKILVAGLVGSIWLYITLQLVAFIAYRLFPYSIPSGILRYSPSLIIFDSILLSFTASFLFDTIEGCLKGDTIKKGLLFGGILTLVWGARAIASGIQIIFPFGMYFASFLEYIFVVPLLGVIIELLFEYKFKFKNAPQPINWLQNVELFF
jgi:hypothetical protein